MSGSIRLFVPAPLAAGETVAATSGQAHYLARVMRRAVGDTVLLFNGQDGEWAARVARLEPEAGRFAVEWQTRPQAPEPDLLLLFVPLRREHTELVVEKATELGVAAIQPVLTARARAAPFNARRLEAIAIEAAEQSERLSVPALTPTRPLAAVLADWPGERRLVAAIEREAAPPPTPIAGPVALLVGPEGGFAPAELDALRAAPFVQPASLGPRILRAETAAIVGLALLLAESRAHAVG